MLSSPAREQARRLPLEPGVYRFRAVDGTVLYSGRATALRSRVGSYFSDGHRRPRLARMTARIDRVEALVCASVHEACWLERNLHERSLPRWNRVPGGQEVPVFIEVNPGPGRPGLALRHDRCGSGLVFGPYLGGWKVRTALSGLQRAVPLGHSGTALSSSEQQFAELRGVRAVDRERLLAQVLGVLTGEPGAISSARAELVRLRDVASAQERYEQAAQLDTEVGCLDWVTSIQRVTSTRLRTGADPVDAVAVGWRDGVLVRFEIRGGRLDGWRQRLCSAAGARRALAASPPEWFDFATANAALAARLLQT